MVAITVQLQVPPNCTAGALLSVQFRYSFPNTLFQATLGFGYQSQMLQPLVSNANQLTIYVFFPREINFKNNLPNFEFYNMHLKKNIRKKANTFHTGEAQGRTPAACSYWAPPVLLCYQQ